MEVMRSLSIMAAVIGLAMAPGAIAADKVKPAPPPAVTPVPPLTPENTWNLDLSTGGRVVIQLRPDKAPQAVERIKTLTRRGFYDGLIFHRVIEGFMAQGGDPKGTGEGGSDLPDLPPEFNDMPHVRGVTSMARADSPDSANSQFFIMLSPNLRLDGKYSPFGRVVSGMAYVDAIEKGEPPANPSKIVHASIGGPAAAAAASPDAANAAAAAAAETASQQSSEAALASQEATKAAAAGDAKTAKERAKAARVAAEGAAEASRDAAEAAGQATPPQN
jgi:cyclophilin family peptidyl-prolyl cis-trans isomerase